MHDITCPYCNHEYDLDDLEGLDNNNELRETCHNDKCNKDFLVYVDFTPNFSDGRKVECWNGEKCLMEKSNTNDFMRCKYCRCIDWKMK